MVDRCRARIPSAFARARRLQLDHAMRLVLACLAVSLTACTVSAVGPTESDPPSPIADRGATSPPAERAPTPAAPKPAAPTPEEDDGTFAEVVDVLMLDRDGDHWLCTGTLVARDRVVTAAHCLDRTKFVSFEVVALLAPGKPQVSASSPAAFGGDYDVVENPDVGVLRLDTPIDLPRYAKLTDVVERVEAGNPLEAVAVVRAEKKPGSPIAPTDSMPLSSTVKYGYEHGFGTPYFSKGGDSGAGLFLVENGKPTHKLIGIARQPEPDRDLDHFTRIDAGFLTWYQAL